VILLLSTFYWTRQQARVLLHFLRTDALRREGGDESESESESDSESESESESEADSESESESEADSESEIALTKMCKQAILVFKDRRGTHPSSIATFVAVRYGCDPTKAQFTRALHSKLFEKQPSGCFKLK
jgi:hypothetical protein